MKPASFCRFKYALLVLVSCALYCAGVSAQNARAIAVKMHLSEDVSSAKATTGQDVEVRVSESVIKDGKVAIAAGAPVRAHLTSVKRAAHGDRAGQIKLTLDSVQTVSGTWVPLHKGKMHRGNRMIALMAGPCSVPFPLTMMMVGEEVNIPHGEALSAYVRTNDLP